MLTALVPMKGHSERVPGKNYRRIAGRPLFAWILTSLLEAQHVHDVVVDTDSDLLEEMVTDTFGGDVRVLRRPEHLHGDDVPMHAIVAHICSTVAGDVFLQTHTTNPLLKSATIDAAVDAYKSSGNHDSLMSVTARYARFYWLDGAPVNHDPGTLLRTQDLPPLLEENSNLYIAPRAVIEATGRRIGSSPLLFSVPGDEAMDIDDELEFFLAGKLLERQL